jgi:ParB family chromosome partitioning protein
MDKIPLTSIIVGSRLRVDLGDIDALSDSIERLGLIQPIVINQNNELIAGGRRIAAFKALSEHIEWADHKEYESIPYVRFETLSEDQKLELELEENIRRKDMTWQEQTLSVCRIHALKQRLASLDMQTWGVLQTGELIGLSGAKVSYALQVGELLLKKDEQISACDSVWEAYKLILVRKSDAVEAELARRAALPASSPVKPLNDTEANAIEEAYAEPTRLLLESMAASDLEHGDEPLMERLAKEENTTPTIGVSSSPNESIHTPAAPHLIQLSKMLYMADSVRMMNDSECPLIGLIDHIVTDPPYAIEMDNIQQAGGGMNISTVEKEHQVDENRKMFPLMLQGFWNVLKPNSYVVFFYDLANHQLLVDLAKAVGFSVQRWPFVWVKTDRCQNMAAQVNFTKSCEYAMVLRKGTPVLAKVQTDGHLACGNLDKVLYGNHPFAKPHELWRRLIEAVSLQGQVILDPFAGRGSAIQTIINLQRKPVGIESNETHFNYMVNSVRRFYSLILRQNVVFS